MPTWRCPHCGTPQTETARCWVCRRSSTACGTCRHFRRSVAAQLGYCGLDRRRAPLIGDEIRACWEDRNGSVAAPGGSPIMLSGDPAGPVAGPRADAGRRLEFIEVDDPRAGDRSRTRRATDDDLPPPASLPAPPAAEPGWNLWGDLEG
jgi:hypothetical protein